jgi:branched-chain amino acid aminotransferase
MTSTSRTESTVGQPEIGLLGGRWTPHNELRLPIGDLGFRQAATAVERLRTYGGAVFQLDAHLDRWQRTIDAIGIEGLPLRPAIEILTGELIGRNQAFNDAVGDFGITMFATPGGHRGDSPTFGMHLNAIDHAMVRRRRQRGQTLVVTDISQPPSNCWPRGIKVRSRLHYYLADQIAAAAQADGLAVLVDGDGGVTDTSIASLAIIEAGNVVTPSRERILAGITQQVVQGLARDASIGWSESIISADRLAAADEVLLMGTDGGLWFANRVGKLRVGDGKPGKIFGQLLTRFDDFTGCRI